MKVVIRKAGRSLPFTGMTLAMLYKMRGRIRNRNTIAKLRNLDDRTLREFGLTRLEVEILL